MIHATPPSNLYGLLQVPRDASATDIKTAYHRTLLRLHPDKQSRPRHPRAGETTLPGMTDVDPSRPISVTDGETSVDMALLKEAYETLSDPSLREAYDGSLRRAEHTRSRGPPRPAQAVSLEEFTAIEIASGTESDARSGTGTGADAVRQEWQHWCRCGGTYRITEDDLEKGAHLVGCESCSEVIWVGYEEATTDDGEEE